MKMESIKTFIEFIAQCDVVWVQISNTPYYKDAFLQFSPEQHMQLIVGLRVLSVLTYQNYSDPFRGDENLSVPYCTVQARIGDRGRAFPGELFVSVWSNFKLI